MVPPTDTQKTNRAWNEEIERRRIEGLKMEQTDRVWVLQFHGPRDAVRLKEFAEQKKTLVQIGSEIELVESASVFGTKQECYAAAIAKKTQEGMACFQRVQQWQAEMMKQVPPA